MNGLFVVLLISAIASPSLCARVSLEASPTIFNVVSYGAGGDGKTDDSQAFVKAWEALCSSTQQSARLYIPETKTFMLQPVSFEGPCKPTAINVQVEGTIIAPKSIRAWRWQNGKSKWIQFSNVDGLVVNGKGKIDGQGDAWWNNVSDRPTALHFHNCGNLRLMETTHINSPRNHISIDTCNGAQISNIHIFAPKDSPNTDGIDISGSSNILIQHSTIQTGDDCIAINSGSSFINITDINCGPGHGISVGSLGRNGDYAKVEEVHVRNCTFNGSDNGVRIKTWMGGSGYARKITFEDIIVVGVKYPVIINQQYVAFLSQRQAVKISDVTYRNVRGTSSLEDSVVLKCDPSVGCTNIVLDEIRITTEDGKKTQVSCDNARGISSNCDPTIGRCLSKN